MYGNTGHYGDYQSANDDQTIANFAIAPPGRMRAFKARLANGRDVVGTAQAALTFGIPLYDKVWKGSLVSGTVDGQHMVGTINDWLAEDQHYAAAL